MLRYQGPIVSFPPALPPLTRDITVKGESPHGRDGWYPAESLTRRQALWGFTMGGAYASFSEHRTGSLEVGKEADFVILDRDLLREDTDVLGTQVRATVVGGVCRAGRL